MIEIKYETPMIAISRDIYKALEGTGITCENEGDIIHQKFYVKLVKRGEILFASSSTSWRDALIDAHNYVKENIKKK